MYLNLEQVRTYLIEKKKFRIVFLGDSITSTEWVHPNWREIVEYVVKEELCKIIDDWKLPSWQVRGINCGFDGATTKDILAKLEEEILNYEPDLIISIMGGNDISLGISIKESIKNIEDILRKCIKSVPFVFWCNSTPSLYKNIKNIEYKPYAEKTLRINISSKVKLFDMFNEYQNFNLSQFFTFRSEENLIEDIKEGEIDPQHPNMLGNTYIAKIILKEVFDIDFKPENYLKTLLAGEKYPSY